MKLSRTVAYAVRATLALAQAESDGPVPCSKLAAEGKMPERFLLQILRSLVTHGILRSTRGVDGGYALVRPAEEISLLEVIEAIEQASHFHVNIDQLMEAAGKHISELLKVEWGMVTSGAAAALSHATAGIVAGTNPELMQQLPDLTGMRDEVIIPRESRNQYDHAVRGVGLRLVPRP